MLVGIIMLKNYELLYKYRDFVPSLPAAVKLLSPHCCLLTERAGLPLFYVGTFCFTTFQAMACCTTHFGVETLLHRSHQQGVTANLKTDPLEQNSTGL